MRRFSLVGLLLCNWHQTVASGAQAKALDDRLIAAVLQADAPTVKALLDQDADTEVVTSREDGITPLMLSASGSTSRPRAMRKPGFPSNVSLPDWKRADPEPDILVDEWPAIA